MKRLPVLAFAAAMALWGLASIPGGGGDGSSTIDGVRSAARLGAAPAEQTYSNCDRSAFRRLNNAKSRPPHRLQMR